MAAPTIADYTISENTSALVSPYDQAVTMPSSSEGDLLIAYLYNQQSRVVDSVPSGWNLLDSVTVDAQSWLFAYWKLAVASEPGSYTWSWNNSTDSQHGIMSISGAENPSTNAIETATSHDTGSSGATTSPTVTPSDTDSLVLRIVGEERNGTFTVPSGETLLFNSTGSSTAAAISYFTHGASATGTGTWGYTPTWHTQFPHIVLAIAPASGGGGPTGSPWYYYNQQG